MIQIYRYSLYLFKCLDGFRNQTESITGFATTFNLNLGKLLLRDSWFILSFLFYRFWQLKVKRIIHYSRKIEWAQFFFDMPPASALNAVTQIKKIKLFRNRVFCNWFPRMAKYLKRTLFRCREKRTVCINMALVGNHSERASLFLSK